ncbi:hybrid signal transduction histidine kinase M-like, partial [Topomyia yanbarensis]|uniref:hybrid signal transduction histidine kinase M-like n=1 Tax=Topomyia yanbarensis TaxID=2498891 RepID=UPI00273CC65D
LEAPPPPPRRGGSQHQICPGSNCNGTATTFLQLSQEHLKQPGMKLFPNYTPPIPPHTGTNSNASTGNFSTLSNNVNNHHYHQITYQTQTLAPLRLNQDHFNSKTNTLGGGGGGGGLTVCSGQPNGRQKYQTHHHHHHHQHQHPQQQQLQQQQSHHHQLSDHELDDDVFDDNEDDSNNSGTTSPPPASLQMSPSTPTPPELPIRNGLVANYNVNTLNHINNNTVVVAAGSVAGGGVGSGGGGGGCAIRENGIKMSSPGTVAITGERPVVMNGGGRKAARHYH